MDKLIIAKSNRGAPDPIGLHNASDDTTPINPAIEEKQDQILSVLQNIDANTDQLELKADQVNLNTDELESKVQEVSDRIGQTSGQTLASWLQDIWTKINDAFITGLAKIKIWDGTNQLGIDSTNHAYVSGKSPAGSPPSANPISVAGIDTQGNKRNILTDTTGQLYVIPAQVAGFLPVQIKYQAQHSAVNAGEWQEMLTYMVPAGYEFHSSIFEGWTQSAGESIRAIHKDINGTFDCPTNTFTPDGEILAPQFATEIYLYVTSAIGAGVNDDFTITYINQDGIGGRTATASITKSSLVGTRVKATLQAGDYGVRDITNVTHSATGQAGAVNFEITSELFYLLLDSANKQYHATAVASGTQIVPENGEITLQYLAGTKTAYTRRINISGILVPR